MKNTLKVIPGNKRAVEMIAVCTAILALFSAPRLAKFQIMSAMSWGVNSATRFLAAIFSNSCVTHQSQ